LGVLSSGRIWVFPEGRIRVFPDRFDPLEKTYIIAVSVELFEVGEAAR